MAALHHTNHAVARQKNGADRIKRIVAAHHHMTVERLMTPRRLGDIVLARHVAMFLCRQETAMSYPDIARAFGKKDHGSAMHAMEVVFEKMATDPAFERGVQALRDKISATDKPEVVT